MKCKKSPYPKAFLPRVSKTDDGARRSPVVVKTVWAFGLMGSFFLKGVAMALVLLDSYLIPSPFDPVVLR